MVNPVLPPSIRIRGFGTLVSGASDPLYVVDGVPFDGNMAELNSNDIESMSILKDAASAALYGNRAANGVVIITTKSGRNTHKPSITLQMNQGMYNRGIPRVRPSGCRPLDGSYLDGQEECHDEQCRHVGKRCCRICHGTRG